VFHSTPKERTNLSESPGCIKLTFHNCPSFFLVVELVECAHRFFVFAKAMGRGVASFIWDGRNVLRALLPLASPALLIDP